jgi:hypothetical protein
MSTYRYVDVPICRRTDISTTMYRYSDTFVPLSRHVDIAVCRGSGTVRYVDKINNIKKHHLHGKSHLPVKLSNVNNSTLSIIVIKLTECRYYGTQYSKNIVPTSRHFRTVISTLLYRYIDIFVPLYRHLRTVISTFSYYYIFVPLYRHIRSVKSTFSYRYIDIFVPLYRHFRTVISTFSYRYIDIFVPLYRHFRTDISTFSYRYIDIFHFLHLRTGVTLRSY